VSPLRDKGVKMLFELAQAVGLKLVPDCETCSGTGTCFVPRELGGSEEVDCIECPCRRAMLTAIRTTADLERAIGGVASSRRGRSSDEEAKRDRGRRFLRERHLYALGLLWDELRSARAAHPEPYAGRHQGWALIKEEHDELWEEVRKKQPWDERLAEEAIQTAQTALRFVVDLCRLGCVACSDSTCEEHDHQEHAGDYTMSRKEFLASRSEGPL
jgi:hypothetical protein